MDSELRIRLRQALFEFFDQSYGGLPVEETDLAEKIDSIVREAYKAGEDHALAAVVRERTIEHHDIAMLMREFHGTFRLPMSDVPELVDGNLARQRHQILLKEVTEVYDAVLQNNLPGIAQELADCVYVLYGTALTYGIDLDRVLATVHQANMTKLFPDSQPHTLDGKVVKGPDYRKPDIAEVLARQTDRPVNDGYGFGPTHSLRVVLVEHADRSLGLLPHYELEHPAECSELPYGQRCALDQPGDDRLDWPVKPERYHISAWSSKTWTDSGWEYDAGVQWEVAGS